MTIDCLKRRLEVGDIVVVKPTSRTSFMGIGFIKKVHPSRASVRSFRRTSWYNKEFKVLTSTFESPSIFRICSAKDMQDVHKFPEGFPEELKQEYINEFLTRTPPSP